ncbi:COG2426 family protein [Chloroflexota bacterium]
MDILDIIRVLVIAASPISELRGAIPFAIGYYHFPWYYAFLIAVIGNLAPVPLILFFLETASKLVGRVPCLDRLQQWLFSKLRRRGKLVERYERIGLALFVAIPLPITGAWTGSILAVLFGLKRRTSLLSITVGVILAGVIVTIATVFGWRLAGLLTGE